MLLSRLLLPNLSRLFFNDTATTEIYTLSLHDALPISRPVRPPDRSPARRAAARRLARRGERGADRKSTRLNSSHVEISYAVFCLKKKKIDWTLVGVVAVTQRPSALRFLRDADRTPPAL